jgi:hypothetical protein
VKAKTKTPMKISVVSTWRKCVWAALIGVSLCACQDESERISTEQAKTQTRVAAEDNNEIVAATQEAMEITSNAFEEEGISNGRASSGGEFRGGHHGDDHGCRPSISGSFDLDRSKEDTLMYTGTITIDYGDGSSCNSDHVRKGKITDTFSYILTWGDSITFTSIETITFESFVRDSVQLDGTFIITSTKGKKTVEVQNAKLTYPDGTSVNWDGELIYVYDRGEKCKWSDNTIRITGSITGTNREGAEFSWVITEELVYKYKCDHRHRFRPVSGAVEVTIGGALSVVDFGDGDCDKKYTITVDGETTEFEFDSH